MFRVETGPEWIHPNFSPERCYCNMTKRFDLNMMSLYIYGIAAFLIVSSVSAVIQPGWCSRNIKDQTGRIVSTPDDPQRIVALAPSITEIIFALGQEHRLRGVTRFSDYPQAADNLPKVGSYIHLDLEKIVALNPDLCIAIKDGNPREVIKRLESLNIPVYAVDPRNFATVMTSLQEIGVLLNAENRAESLSLEIQSRIQQVKSGVEKSYRRPRVFFQIGISPIVSAGTDTFIHEMIILAGGENVAEGDVKYPRFSREQVLGLSPEIIIISSMARQAAFEQIKSDWGRWPNLAAVQSGQIYLVDSNLFDRPTPRLIEALELLAGIIHPELFKDAK
mgnify:CR=1 FL=1